MESPSALDIRVLGYTAVVVSIATTSNPQEQTFTASRLKRAYETRLAVEHSARELILIAAR